MVKEDLTITPALSESKHALSAHVTSYTSDTRLTRTLASHWTTAQLSRSYPTAPTLWTAHSDVTVPRLETRQEHILEYPALIEARHKLKKQGKK